ncbi:outer membrane beta-barrel protein [Flavihumibacter petaseus]|uniref:Outer membrane protein beta-barrel domain-containing protein n=1 Tax=Flavihumibacter petaseus NBRC 106054 TaxID=1220578 RepID=A0A0E9MTB3_9BACT|nr:outer membrane beta-barrel protein [Flavihumibacter petaseus]GAO40997.1 hypothetical protein FPE01S_01_00080 [Flavihumibacter petaseus NBRC 106054]
MKKLLGFTCLFCLAALLQSAQAQKIRLNAYAGYVFDDNVDSYYSNTSYFNGTIQGSFQWGAGIEYRLHDAYGIELLYYRQDTKAPITYYDYNSLREKYSNVDVAVNYILIGGARNFARSERFEPYGGFMLGVGIIDAENPDTDFKGSATKFAWGLRLGTNIWTSGAIGLKLQAQLLSCTQAAGGGIYFGTGGVGTGVSTYSSMLQFGLGGGLTFRLQGAKK